MSKENNYTDKIISLWKDEEFSNKIKLEIPDISKIVVLSLDDEPPHFNRKRLRLYFGDGDIKSFMVCEMYANEVKYHTVTEEL